MRGRVHGIEPLGDAAILVRVGRRIDEATHRRVRAAYERIAGAEIEGVSDVAPAFTSVSIHYDPLRVGYDALVRTIDALLTDLEHVPLPTGRTIEIPVRYGGAHGPDLELVARHTGLSPAAVVRIHSGGEYLVHMIGFAPGFPYLGGLDPRLACPRRDSPRQRVPAGSVAIGGAQTGIYPLDTPGGWQLIGRTERVLFDAAADPPCLLAPGDRVRFVELRA